MNFLIISTKLIDLEQKILNITLKSRILKYKSLKNSKKEKEYEIFHDYDMSLKIFKDSLYNAIDDSLKKNTNEIDILIVIIRKLPEILSFYGKSKSMELVKFIIDNFNNEEWIIQKEIVIQIPKIMSTLGKKILMIIFYLV